MPSKVLPLSSAAACGRSGSAVGVVGTAVSRSAMMFSLFPALLGTVGASVSSSMPGTPGVASTPTSALPDGFNW